MRPQTQKPDGNLHEFREILKSLEQYGKLDYLEPPLGFGCDVVIYIGERVIFLEVKTFYKRKRFTPQELVLREICERHGIPYLVFWDSEEFGEFIIGQV